MTKNWNDRGSIYFWTYLHFSRNFAFSSSNDEKICPLMIFCFERIVWKIKIVYADHSRLDLKIAQDIQELECKIQIRILISLKLIVIFTITVKVINNCVHWLCKALPELWISDSRALQIYFGSHRAIQWIRIRALIFISNK